MCPTFLSGVLCAHRRYFYATLLLGTPQRQFAVIVDTGSTITYVPCASCGKNCGPHHKARDSACPHCGRMCLAACVVPIACAGGG